MENLLSALIDENDLTEFKEFISFISDSDNGMMLRNGIIQMFRKYCQTSEKSKAFQKNSSVFSFIKQAQELFPVDDHLAILHRHAIAKYRFYLVRKDGEYIEEISPARYLDFKDAFVSPTSHPGLSLRLDFMPFYDFTPTLRDVRSVGNGIRFLNRYMSSNIFSRPQKWVNNLFNFIKAHRYNGQQLLVNGAMAKDVEAFLQELEQTAAWLSEEAPETLYSELQFRLKKSGFEVGWGNTAGRVLESMQTLLSLVSEPTDELLEKFISRVPMPLISRVAIISPHGWFGQTNALGKPDTGGQVIYILDQVRALERHLKKELHLAGLEIDPKIIVLTRLIPEAKDTTCNQRLEKIFHTENGWILRVPFRDSQYNVVKNWVSRFKIWPYLETFAEDSASELRSEFQGRPDLVIGNYSDGNLAASLLADKFDVVQCTIAHALEKTKYALSDLKWKAFERDYNFSMQYTADLISMNKSDFIITSTLQEIIGNEDTMGQYESYQIFTMPGLYQVTNGINLFAPKFNVIPPGVDEDLYFPYHEQSRRLKSKQQSWQKRLYSDESDNIYGILDDPGKPPIFTMARFDKIKNITGLIEAFGLSTKLQQHFNLVFAAGTIHPENSSDVEERNEIKKAYDLMRHYNLYGKVRWLPSINKLDTGEVYRIIADHGGIFVQPALFEAFGLTIIEAMASGLPTFAPQFGGPLEIIEDGTSGFLLNTSKPEFIAAGIEAFIDIISSDDTFWKTISENGIKRVRTHFNWKSYSQRLVNLTKLYGFWRYAVSEKGMLELDRYCDALYHFLIKEKAARIGQTGLAYP
jgi:sucrose synthase